MSMRTDHQTIENRMRDWTFWFTMLFILMTLWGYMPLLSGTETPNTSPAESLRKQAEEAYDTGDIEGSLILFQEAAKAFGKGGLSQEQARTFFKIALALEDLGNRAIRLTQVPTICSVSIGVTFVRIEY